MYFILIGTDEQNTDSHLNFTTSQLYYFLTALRDQSTVFCHMEFVAMGIIVVSPLYINEE